MFLARQEYANRLELWSAEFLRRLHLYDLVKTANAVRWKYLVLPRYSRLHGPRVALASFPRSGNTWLRILLEEATGERTGTVYVNQDGVIHRPRDGIAIKTHNLDSYRYTKAVHLVRNPLDAIESYFQFRQDFWGEKISWSTHIEQAVEGWRAHTLHWMDAPYPVLLVRYEDLHAAPAQELDRVLQWLRADTTSLDLAGAVERSQIERLRRRHKEEGPRFFRRGAVNRSAGAYTADERGLVLQELGNLMNRLGYTVDEVQCHTGGKDADAS